jgi:hypothetical protein
MAVHVFCVVCFFCVCVCVCVCVFNLARINFINGQHNLKHINEVRNITITNEACFV